MEHISTSQEPQAGAHGVASIVSTPGTCGGKPRIAGTRIRVEDIYVWHEAWGQSPEEIVRDFPHLSLAQVYAALAYYHDHRDEIHRSRREAEEKIDVLARDYPLRVLSLNSPAPHGAPFPPG